MMEALRIKIEDNHLYVYIKKGATYYTIADRKLEVDCLDGRVKDMSIEKPFKVVMDSFQEEDGTLPSWQRQLWERGVFDE